MAPEPDARRPGRYAVAELRDGDILIYDTVDDDAWLRSDTTRSLSNAI